MYWLGLLLPVYLFCYCCLLPSMTSIPWFHGTTFPTKKNSISPWDHVGFEIFHLLCVCMSLLYHLDMGFCGWLSVVLELHSAESCWWCHWASHGQKFNNSWSAWPILLVFAVLEPSFNIARTFCGSIGLIVNAAWVALFRVVGFFPHDWPQPH